MQFKNQFFGYIQNSLDTYLHAIFKCICEKDFIISNEYSNFSLTKRSHQLKVSLSLKYWLTMVCIRSLNRRATLLKFVVLDQQVRYLSLIKSWFSTQLFSVSCRLTLPLPKEWFYVLLSVDLFTFSTSGRLQVLWNKSVDKFPSSSNMSFLAFRQYHLSWYLRWVPLPIIPSKWSWAYPVRLAVPWRCSNFLLVLFLFHWSANAMMLWSSLFQMRMNQNLPTQLFNVSLSITSEIVQEGASSWIFCTCDLYLLQEVMVSLD